MRRNNVGFLAALVAFGAVALTACGSGQSGTAAPVQEQAQTQQAGEQSEVDFLRGTANSNKADKATGDRAPEVAAPEVKLKWVELRVANAGGLEPAVVNGAGRTVYWFSDDPVGGGVSNCNGDCEKTWTPVTVAKGTRLFFPGIKRENIGFIKRKDGRTTQVTIGGRPIYLFTKDEKPGDIKGQNVGNKWFVINPEGKRATAPAEAPATAPAPAPGAKAASSVTFFSGKNFDDFSGNNFATGVQPETTCNDLRGGFPSLTTDGSVKIWSEPGCKGKSAVVTDDVRDTAALGFPDGVKSYIRA